MDLIGKINKLFENNSVVNIQFIKNNEQLEYFADGTKIYSNINASENFSNGRMVISSTSINLARLGLKYQNKNIEDFYEELSNIAELVKNELLLSFEIIGSKSKDYYRSLFTGNIYDDEKLESGQKIRKVIKNGVLNIGIIGLKECAICLEKTEVKRQKLIENVIDYLKTKCEEYMKDTKMNFGLYEPISKHARSRLLAIDKAIYGTVTDVTDKKRYDLLDLDLMEGYCDLAKIQKKLTSGKLVTVNLSGKLTIKKIADTLETLNSGNIEFAKVVVGKDEY